MIGYVDSVECPDTSSTVSRMTREWQIDTRDWLGMRIADPPCICSDHPFKFTRALVVEPIRKWMHRLNAIKDEYIVAQRDGTFGYIRRRGGSLVYLEDHMKFHDLDDTVNCVIAEPYRKQVTLHPIAYVTCSIKHRMLLPNPDVSTQLITWHAHPSVKRAYSEALRQHLGVPSIHPAVAKPIREFIDSQISMHMVECLERYNANQFTDRKCVTLLRACARAVQQLIMQGRMSPDSQFARVCKDVCKIIHRMVFM